MSDTNKERQAAVREAWRNEKARVREGKGTRDWSQSEQKEIVAKGRASGYEGHHMKSVKDCREHAGDPNNIQFLNHAEHINGAHKGNTKNATNGYYNPQTGEMHPFGDQKPQAPPSQALSSPITQRQQDIAIKSEQARKQAAQQAKAEAKQDVSKTTANNAQSDSSANSAIRSPDNEAARQNTGDGQSAKDALLNADGKSSGQSTGASNSAIKGTSADNGSSNSTTSAVQSNSTGGQGM